MIWIPFIRAFDAIFVFDVNISGGVLTENRLTGRNETSKSIGSRSVPFLRWWPTNDVPLVRRNFRRRLLRFVRRSQHWHLIEKMLGDERRDCLQNEPSAALIFAALRIPRSIRRACNADESGIVVSDKR